MPRGFIDQHETEIEAGSFTQDISWLSRSSQIICIYVRWLYQS